jgi:hypothetical protein
MRIAQGFSLGWGVRTRFRPEGTGDGVPGRISAIPPGREHDSTQNPTLKRWAIVGVSFRDKSRLDFRKALTLSPMLKLCRSSGLTFWLDTITGYGHHGHRE